MKEYEKEVDILNVIGDSFGEEKGLKDTTFESQIKKKKPEYLEDIFFCVDTVHLPAQGVHILVERQFAKGDYMIYEEIKENRDPKGILTKFSWKYKESQIKVEAEYKPLKKDNALVRKAYNRIDRYIRQKKIPL